MLQLPARGAGCQDRWLLPSEARPLGPAGGGGPARRGGWWAGESSAGILGGKASFLPGGREGRVAARCLLPALRKVTGDLPEGYLGAGIRRELAPRKAPDLPLKKLEAVHTRQCSNVDGRRVPVSWESSRCGEPPQPPLCMAQCTRWRRRSRGSTHCTCAATF